MEEKDREMKRARTVRTDYKRAIEEIQGWIQNAELKVQDRTSEPLQLKENLSVRRRFLCPVLIEFKMRMNINIYNHLFYKEHLHCSVLSNAFSLSSSKYKVKLEVLVTNWIVLQRVGT
jgi:hypothetical protein